MKYGSLIHYEKNIKYSFLLLFFSFLQKRCIFALYLHTSQNMSTQAMSKVIESRGRRFWFVFFADGDIVDLAGNVFLLPVTEYSHFAHFIWHPDKKAAYLHSCNFWDIVEIIHVGLDTGWYLVHVFSYFLFWSRKNSFCCSISRRSSSCVGM